jgi:dTDP-4-amino-4,6-dideoxygalactose transaminase
MINVTKVFLPPLEEYVELIKGVWERNHITNHGPLVTALEEQLKQYLGVKHLFFVSNCTVAIQIAIKALALKNQIITTPFSYVATTSAAVWEGLEPVFADIDEETLCIDTASIIAKITPQTEAILATHVYGNSCQVKEIEAIAKQYNLKVIYDGAHAFNTKLNGNSILNYGDISTLSFHATKLFHSCEGGAIITNDDALAHKISYLRNFGHNGAEKFHGIGINGKNSELHAAMGLSLFPYIDKIIASRKSISLTYSEYINFDKVKKPILHPAIDYNFAYYPIIFQSEEILLRVIDALNQYDIFPRRYFYPSLNTLHYVKPQTCVVSENIACRILCLPLYYGLEESNIQQIASIINQNS